MGWIALLFLFAAPFWQTKAPADWTLDQLTQLLTDSPWAQMITAPGSADAPPVQVYLATAAPIEQAERQWDLKKPPEKKSKPVDTTGDDYRAWIDENRAADVIVAVAIGNPMAFSDEQEVRRMENESVMRVGRKKFKIDGHFPPSPGDPYLRLAFPRQVKTTDKTVTFELYLPGVSIPYREAEFKVRDLMLDGKLEM